MKDRILSAYVKDFIDRFGLKHLNDSEAFERFVNYCVVSRYHPDSFDPDELSVGGGGDLGLDGIAILVNDHLVFANDDVDYLKKTLRRLDAQFLFTQSKTTPRFDSASIANMLSGVRGFFGQFEPAYANAAVRSMFQVKEHIFRSTVDMDRSPQCHLYYASTGTWEGDTQLQARIEQGLADIRVTGLFSSVTFLPVGSETLKRWYRELHHKVVREIVFEKHTILPQITGVQEAYIGIVPCSEYLKLIRDDDGTLNRSLFYDNVRDFQGHNPVNTEIDATIQDSSRSDRFVLLNNGVTIVAHDINKVGTSFKLKDFQIVNGCQTSHILYRSAEKLTPHTYLPLKLIVTTDAEVTNQVIKGTNRQTEVLLEAFESLAPFQKQLEELYIALGRDKPEPLYYERRSKQYEHLAIRRERIITLATQVKCFVAMFLNEPHSTHRYYGELLSAYRSRVFGETHSPLPYYVSGATLATIERLFSDGKLSRTWRQLKYQIIMVFRHQSEPTALPGLSSSAIEKYSEAFLAMLDSPERVEEALRRAGDLVFSLYRPSDSLREAPERTKAFTSLLLDAAARDREQRTITESLLTGVVKSFSEVKGWGFIVLDGGGDVFVHNSNFPLDLLTLRRGQRVRFSVAKTPRGVQAVDVELI